MSQAFKLDGKAAIVATMRGKGRFIEPALSGLELRFLAAPSIDIDRYGTFTRDIDSAGDLASLEMQIKDLPRHKCVIAIAG